MQWRRMCRLAPGRAAAEELLLDVSVERRGGAGGGHRGVTERAAGGTGTSDAVAAAWASDP